MLLALQVSVLLNSMDGCVRCQYAILVTTEPYCGFSVLQSKASIAPLNIGHYTDIRFQIISH